jgi:antitoxin component YwqK of YwqJK toxin-antitoxin module
VKKWICYFCCLLPYLGLAQGNTRTTYHDAAKKNVKEVYQVKDTATNMLQGRYISYYLNGNIESKGQFVNNETTGAWEFFFETGNLRMRGILRANSNYGLWEFFYESGQKSMEGTIDGFGKYITKVVT